MTARARLPWKYALNQGCCEACMSAIDPAAISLPFPKRRCGRRRCKGCRDRGLPWEPSAPKCAAGSAPVREVARADGVRPEVGSSRKTSSGSSPSARASATRLIMPPDSSDGKRLGDLRSQPDHAELGFGNLVEQSLRDVETFAHRKLDILPAPSARKTTRPAGKGFPSAFRSCAAPRYRRHRDRSRIPRCVR